MEKKKENKRITIKIGRAIQKQLRKDHICHMVDTGKVISFAGYCDLVLARCIRGAK